MKPEQHRYLLEFDKALVFVEAARRLDEHGFRCLEAYTPFPVEAVEAFLPPISNRLPLIMLIGGICGALIGYGIQYYTAVIDYPLLVGGKPMHSWPAFLPVTFELAVLGAALPGFIGAIVCNGLPRLSDPLSDIPGFGMARRNRFFLLVEAGERGLDKRDHSKHIMDLAPNCMRTVKLK